MIIIITSISGSSSSSIIIIMLTVIIMILIIIIIIVSVSIIIALLLIMPSTILYHCLFGFAHTALYMSHYSHLSFRPHLSIILHHDLLTYIIVCCIILNINLRCSVMIIFFVVRLFDSASLPFKYKLWLLRRRRHSPRDFEVSDA